MGGMAGAGAETGQAGPHETSPLQPLLQVPQVLPRLVHENPMHEHPPLVHVAFVPELAHEPQSNVFPHPSLIEPHDVCCAEHVVWVQEVTH